jgi:hypothetical protein
MSESGTSEDVYAPPASDLGADARRSSPRLRFWLACLWSLIFAPVIFYGLIAIQAPMSLFPVMALAAWLAPLSWVLSAHLQFSTGGTGFIRMIIVAVGLSMAMGFFALLGMSIAAAMLGDPAFDQL